MIALPLQGSPRKEGNRVFVGDKFIPYLNTTMTLNLAIRGFVKQDNHVICTAIEHDSIRCSLEYLKTSKNVQITYILTDSTGTISVDEFRNAIRINTSLIVCNHSSNVLGNLIPIEQISELAHQYGIKLLVDAAHTAGFSFSWTQRTVRSSWDRRFVCPSGSGIGAFIARGNREFF
ncbi:hypothetical protein BK127_40400 [Paenibacillus sp. FSL H7-0331]|nr:hypothetical protein BK127_40400 [Paenibacillus sp. FSL H7-0331]